jgi:hypothetical protein
MVAQSYHAEFPGTKATPAFRARGKSPDGYRFSMEIEAGGIFVIYSPIIFSLFLQKGLDFVSLRKN